MLSTCSSHANHTAGDLNGRLKEKGMCMKIARVGKRVILNTKVLISLKSGREGFTAHSSFPINRQEIIWYKYGAII